MLLSNKKIIYFILILAAGLIFCHAGASAEADFDPDYIISDAEMLDASTMTLEDIEAFLVDKNSYLANYKTANADGRTKTAAEIIYEAANNYDCYGVELSDNPTRAERAIKCPPATINPKVLLVLLQKEQSLIENPAPAKSELDWATGYGCPDSRACNTYWQGFGKQVNSAALQFYDYMENYRKSLLDENDEDYEDYHYTYKAGNTYTVSNTAHPDIQIMPQNQATAALYNYTPHVYWGNYNFYNLWRRYFTVNYPNGSLLQARGEPGVWLIQNGKKRPFLSRGALTSRFDTAKIIAVDESELDGYPLGAPVKFPQYSLVRSPRGTIYLLVDDQRRGFASSEAFRRIGYNPAEVMDASWEDINAYTEGPPITASSTYPTGALLQDKTTGGVYWVTEGTKAPLWDAALLATKFRGKVIIPETPEKLASFETVAPVVFDNGELLKSNTSSGVYVIEDGKKRPVTSAGVFTGLGYKWNNIVTVSNKILDLYPFGEPLSQVYNSDVDSSNIDS